MHTINGREVYRLCGRTVGDETSNSQTEASGNNETNDDLNLNVSFMPEAIDLKDQINKKFSEKRNPPKNKPKSKKLKEKLSIFFLNGDGGFKNRSGQSGIKDPIKKLTFKSRSFDDVIYVGNELNLKQDQDEDILLSNDFGVQCGLVSGHEYKFDPKQMGLRVKCDKKHKMQGYGTAIVSRIKDLVEFRVRSDDFEVMGGVVRYGEVVGAIIAGYRPPTMIRACDQEEYFEEVNRCIELLKMQDDPDWIIYIADDNCNGQNDSQQKRLAGFQNQVMVKHQMVNLIGDEITRPSRKAGCPGTQPDSCFGWFKPGKAQICAHVVGQVHKSCDHFGIRIEIRSNSIIARKKDFSKIVKRRVRVQTDEWIYEEFEAQFKVFNQINCKELYELFIEEAENPDKLEEIREKYKFDEKDVESALEQFNRNFNSVMSRAYKWKTSKIEANIPETDDAITVRARSADADVADCQHRIEKDPDNIQLREEMIKLQNINYKIGAEKYKHDFAKLANETVGKKYTRTAKFFETAGKLLAKKPIDTENAADQMDDETINQRLEDNEMTYWNKNLPDSPEIDLSKVISAEKCRNAIWNEDMVVLEDVIKTTNKIDPTFRIYRGALIKEIYCIIRLIEMAQYFPTSLKVTKLTILKDRIIYSLGPLAKIVERFFFRIFHKATRRDYEENGDPFQMAYEENRGATTAVFNMLTEIERNVKREKISVHKIGCDLKKAFNSAPWQLMVEEAERCTGLGKLFWSWLACRQHKFGDAIIDEKHNCGVPQGTVLGNWGFKHFINRDVAMTVLNKALLYATLFSDDRDILVSGMQIEDGTAQEILDDSAEFMDKWGPKYHETGKKQATILSFTLKKFKLTHAEKIDKIANNLKCTCTITDQVKIVIDKKCKICSAEKQKLFHMDCDISKLQLNGFPVKPVTHQRMLGINILTDSNNQEFVKVIKKHSYALDMKESKYYALSTKFQQIKYENQPVQQKTLIEAFMGGRLNYGAGLYWLRAPEEQMNRVRYHYMLAVASILGLCAYESIGGSSLNYRSVSEGCKIPESIIKMAGCRTLRDIAIQDARNLIKQTFLLRGKDVFCVSRTRNGFEVEVENDEGREIISSDIKEFIAKKKPIYAPHKFKLMTENDFSEDEFNKRPTQRDLTDPRADDDVDFVDDEIVVNKPYRPPKCVNPNYTGTILEEMLDLAKQKTTREMNRSWRQLRCYNSIWLQSLNIVRSENINKIIRPNYAIAFSLYANQIRSEMSILNENDRALKNRTPSNFLKINQDCRVLPPNRKIGKLKNKAYGNEISKHALNCRKTWYPYVDEEDEDHCLSCNGAIGKLEHVCCRYCGRKIHNQCASECRKHTYFTCDLVEHKKGVQPRTIEPTDPDWKSKKDIPIINPKEPLYLQKKLEYEVPLECKQRNLCLVCGFAMTHSNAIICSKKGTNPTERCNFKAHRKCVEMINIIKNKNIDLNNFNCDDVCTQISVNDVRNLANPNYVRQFDKAQKTNFIKRNIVRKDKRRRPRYELDVINCRICKKDYDLFEENHIEINCPHFHERRTVIKLKKRKISVDYSSDETAKILHTYSKYESCNFDVD